MQHSEEKIKVQDSNYWLEAKSEGCILKFSVLILGDTKELIKISRIMDIEKQRRELLQFQNACEIIKMMKNPENYELDLKNYNITIKWKIQASGYEKVVICKISLFPENITKFQKLQLENHFLRQKLRKYQTQFGSQDSYSLSPQISQGFPHIPNTESITSQEFSHRVDHKDPQDSLRFKHEEQSRIIEIESKSDDNGGELLKQNIKKRGRSKKCGSKRKQIKKQQKQSATRKRNVGLTDEDQEMSKKEKNSNVLDKTSKGDTKIKVNYDKQKQEGKKKGKNSQHKRIIEDKLVQTNRIKIGDKVRIEYSNGDYYFGQLQNNQYHGQGVYYSKTQGKYDGQWINGQASGKGKSEDLDGNLHEGLYTDDMKQGWGIEKYKNGQKYEGQFYKNLKSGLGKYWFENGDTYEGEWKNDMCHGIGHQNYQDGSFYSGRWVEDEKDGEGFFTTKAGERLKQVWNNGTLLSEQKLT